MLLRVVFYMFDIRVYSKTAFSKKKTKSIFTLRGKERTKSSLQCLLFKTMAAPIIL